MIIGKFSSFFYRYIEMRSVKLLESIVRRIFYRFLKTFVKVVVFLVGSPFLPSISVGPLGKSMVHAVSTKSKICENPATSIDPPDPDFGLV